MCYTVCMLYDELRLAMQRAMKERQPVRLQSLRLALAACTEELVAKGMKPTETLEDSAVEAVLRRLVKQRHESAVQYRSADHEERAAAEDEERAVLESFLPAAMDEEEVRTITLQVVADLGASGEGDFGRVMKEVMRQVQGRADGSVVSRVVRDILH